MGSPHGGGSMISHDKSPKGIFANSRKTFLAGAAAVALLGLGASEMMLVPSTPAQAQIQVTPPANAPASFAPIVKQVLPAVVSVKVEINDAQSMMSSNEGRGGPESLQPRRTPRHGMAQGSGFFISPDGYVVTNNHVVSKGDKVELTTNDGATYSAKVVGVDEKTDLALLKVDDTKGQTFPFVKFADKTPEVGDWVVAVGNPFGLGGTVTAGIVSARGRDIGAGPYDDFLQIDAPINRGNSGGPTFDLNGEVVGMNTAIYSPSGGSVGLAFAVPATTVSA